MANLSQEPLYGSVLQSIKRGRPSEIDFINGEIIGLGRETGVATPLNTKMVEMVHRVEKTGEFLEVEDILSEARV